MALSRFSCSCTLTFDRTSQTMIGGSMCSAAGRSHVQENLEVCAHFEKSGNPPQDPNLQRTIARRQEVRSRMSHWAQHYLGVLDLPLPQAMETHFLFQKAASLSNQIYLHLFPLLQRWQRCPLSGLQTSHRLQASPTS